MPSPNVGNVKVTLGLDFDVTQLQQALTKSVGEKVLPEINALNTEFLDLQKNIDAINAQPLAAISQQYENIANQQLKVRRARKTETEAQNTMTKTRLKEAAALDKVNEAIAERDRQIAATGSANVDAINAVTTAEDNYALALDDTIAKQQGLQNAQQATSEAYISEIRKQQYASTEVFRDRQKEITDLANQQIREGQRVSRAERAEQRKAERAARASKRSIGQFISDSAGSIGSIFQIGRVGPAALLAVTAVVVQLVSIVSALSGALGTLPGLFAAAGAAAGVFQVAIYGIEDAVGALISGDMDAFAEALAKLAPNAQQAMLSLQQLMPALDEIRRGVQDRFFEGFNEQLYALSNTFLPLIEEGMNSLADIFNSFGTTFSEALQSPMVASAIENTVGSVVAAFAALEPAIEPLTQAFAVLMEVGSSFLPQLSDYVVQLANDFRDFIMEAAESGQLEEWIQTGIDAAKDLIEVMKELTELFIAFGPLGEASILQVVYAFGILNTTIDVVLDLLEPLIGERGSNRSQFYAMMEINKAAIVLMGEAFKDVANSIVAMYNMAFPYLDKLVDKIRPVYRLLQMASTVFNIPIPDLPDIPELTWAPLPYSRDTAPDSVSRNALDAQYGYDPQSKGLFNPTYSYPGTLPVPPPPAKGPDGKKITDSDKVDQAMKDAKAAAESKPKFDVRAELNQVTDAINTAPGNPGQPPLKAEVTNLPDNLGSTTTNIINNAPTSAVATTTLPTALPEVTGSSLSREQQKIAFMIVDAASKRGYNVNQTQAILSTAMQESNLDPNAVSDNGLWEGIFQQDSGYGNNRKDPLTNITSFFDRLATKGGTEGDIWKNIFWLQQRPAEKSADEAWNDPNARRAYMDEIKSQLPDATAFYQMLLKTAGQPGQAPLRAEITNLPPTLSSSSGLTGSVAMPTNLGPVTDSTSAKPVIDALAQLAQGFNLDVASAVRDEPGSFHHTGNAGDFSNQQRGGPPTQEMNNLAMALLSPSLSPYISELIYSGVPYNINEGVVGPAIDMPGSAYTTAQAGYHGDHVHVGVSDENVQPFLSQLSALVSGAIPPSVVADGTAPVTNPMANGKAAVLPANIGAGEPVPVELSDPPGVVNSAPIMDPATNEYGYFQKNPADILDAENALDDLNDEVNALIVEIDGWKRAIAAGVDRQDELNAAIAKKDKILRPGGKKDDLLAKVDAARRGDFKSLPNGPSPGKAKKEKPFDYSSLPKGDPMRIAAAALAGLGGDDEDIAMILGSPNPAAGAAGLLGANALAAAGGPAGAVAGGVVADALSVPLPGPMGYQYTPTAPSSDLNKLVEERNPAALAQAANIPVPDYSRQGGFDAGAANVAQGQTAPDANGRIYSDTAALIDRTFTNLDASERARHDQTMAVLNEIKASLGKDVLGPAVADATSSAFQGAAAQIGESMGQAAAPPIAAAVEKAVPTPTNTGAGAAGGNGIGGFLKWLGMADGGGVTGGTPGKDSVPAMLMPGEFVLTAAEVRRMGGFAGMEAFRYALARQGGLRFYAAGGNVGSADANKTVGADFFGISQVPIVGALVNMLIAVLLKIIDVQIEQRDTLMQVSSEFRQFRGEFKAFDAAGRLMNDTSGLTDRSSTSEQEAADERIRILKLVIEGIVKFVIEKVVVPISKAVANAVIQAGASSAGGALSAAPGGSFASPLVQALITGTGQAAVEIGAEVYTALALSIAGLVIDTVGEALASSEFGDAIFGGAASAQVIDPIAGLLNAGIGGISASLASIIAALTSLFGGAAMDGTFDSGGVARGMGLMPKATIAPERVLSPSQTRSFDRLVDALASGSPVGQSKTVIHAPFTVQGDEQGARVVHDRLLTLTS